MCESESADSAAFDSAIIATVLAVASPELLELLMVFHKLTPARQAVFLTWLQSQVPSAVDPAWLAIQVAENSVFSRGQRLC